MPLEIAVLNLGVALLLGAAIGFERQWRQRLAGLRTSALVALGAASFTVFAAAFPDEVSPTRVAAQVVSGIGFLGAGIIFREGFNVRGLTTAATLWAVAAIGLLAGSGQYILAVAATGMVIFVNLVLRPLSQFLKRRALPQLDNAESYAVEIVCRASEEARLRTLLMQGLAAGGLHLSGLESETIEQSDRVRIVASLSGQGLTQSALEQIVGRLSLEPAVTAARWRMIAPMED